MSRRAGRVLAVAELVALLGAAVAFVLSAVLVTHGYAVERNPVVRAATGAGWPAAGVGAALALAAAYAVLRRAAVSAPRAATAGATALAGVSVLDAVWDVHVLVQSDVVLTPAALPRRGWAALGATTAAYLAVRYGPAVRQAAPWRAVGHREVRAVATVALAVVMVASGAGPVPPAATPASAETTLNWSQDFEDGDILIDNANYDGWEKTTTGSGTEGFTTTTTDPIEGSVSGEFSVSQSTGAWKSQTQEYRNTTYAEASINITESTGGSDGQIDLQFPFSVSFDQDGSIYVNGTAVQTWTTGTEYHVVWSNISFLDDTYQVRINGVEYGPFDMDDTTYQPNNNFKVYASTGGDGSGSISAKLDDITVRTTTEINGYTKDGSGAIVDNSTVYVRKSGELVHSVGANATGYYETDAPNGTYSLEAVKTGYENGTREVEVSGDLLADRNITHGEHISLSGSSSSSGESQTITYQDNADDGVDWHDDTTIFTVYQADPIGPWSRIGQQDENWQGRATFDGLSNDQYYRLTLSLEHDSVVYEDVGWTPAERPDPWIVKAEGPKAADATATGTTDSAPTVETDGGRVYTYGGTGVREVQYNFSGPNGSTYNYTRTFDEPVDWYGADVTGNYSGINDPSAWEMNYSVQDSTGAWYNGSEDLAAGSGGGAGPMAGGGGGPSPLTVWGAVGATAGAWYFRRPQRRQAAIEALQGAVGGGRP